MRGSQVRRERARGTQTWRRSGKKGKKEEGVEQAVAKVVRRELAARVLDIE